MAADDPIRPELRKTMNGIASVLDATLATAAGRKMGFALLVFDFQDGFMNYIGNAHHSDMAKAMRELIAHWEKQGHA